MNTRLCTDARAADAEKGSGGGQERWALSGLVAPFTFELGTIEACSAPITAQMET